MSKDREAIIKELDSKIPRDVISLRDGGGGRKLSYLEGHYVIDRLNKVLGIGNWAYSSDANLVHSGIVEGKYGPVHSTHYIAKVRLVVNVGGVNTEFTDYGYGDGTDKVNPGKTHELAVKEAITDGIKRCAKNLGQSMGLALYDKTQENVEDAVEEIPVQAVTKLYPTREGLNTLIGSTANVVVAKRALTKAQLQAHLKDTYNVDSKEDLTDAQAQELLTFLKTKIQ